LLAVVPVGADVERVRVDDIGIGVEPEGSAVDVRDFGVEPEGSAVDVRDFGVEPEGSGVDVRDFGVEPEGSGVDVRDLGVEPKGSGVDVRDFGVDVIDFGVDPVGIGVDPDVIDFGVDPVGIGVDPIGFGVDITVGCVPPLDVLPLEGPVPCLVVAVVGVVPVPPIPGVTPVPGFWEVEVVGRPPAGTDALLEPPGVIVLIVPVGDVPGAPPLLVVVGVVWPSDGTPTAGVVVGELPCGIPPREFAPIDSERKIKKPNTQVCLVILLRKR